MRSSWSGQRADTLVSRTTIAVDLCGMKIKVRAKRLPAGPTGVNRDKSYWSQTVTIVLGRPQQ